MRVAPDWVGFAVGNIATARANQPNCAGIFLGLSSPRHRLATECTNGVAVTLD
jgi:hypothetical protein